MDAVYLTPTAPPIGMRGDDSWTAVQIERTVLDVIEALSFVGALTVGGLALAGAVTLPIALVVGIPLALLGGGLLCYRSTLVDYENFKELEKVRTNAIDMSFSDLVSKHGWTKIEKYWIVSPEEMRMKFHAEAVGLTAVEFLKRYDLIALRNHRCLSPQQVAILHDIKRDYEHFRTLYERQERPLLSVYRQGVDLARRMRDLRIEQAALNDRSQVTIEANREYDLRLSILNLEKEQNRAAIRAPFEAQLLSLDGRIRAVLFHCH